MSRRGLNVARFLFALASIASECAGAADAKIEAGAATSGDTCSQCPGDGVSFFGCLRFGAGGGANKGGTLQKKAGVGATRGPRAAPPRHFEAVPVVQPTSRPIARLAMPSAASSTIRARWRIRYSVFVD